MDKSTLRVNSMSRQQRDGERGAALILGLIVLAGVTTMLVPVVKWTSGNHLAGKSQVNVALDRYASDSGAEHALWRIQYESGFVTSLNPTVNYSQTFNSRSTAIRVTAAPTPAAPPPICQSQPGGHVCVLTSVSPSYAAVLETTLSTNLTSSATVLSVDNMVGLDSNPSIVQIDSEQMTVSSISGNQLTVARGANGTTAATHSSGTLVLRATSFVYTLKVMDIGTSTVHFGQFGDLLPAGFAYVPGSTVFNGIQDNSNHPVVAVDPTKSMVSGQQELTWDFGNPAPHVNAGASATISFRAAGAPHIGTWGDAAWAVANPNDIGSVLSISETAPVIAAFPDFDITSAAAGVTTKVRTQRQNVGVILSWQAS